MKATLKQKRHDGKVAQNRKEDHFFTEYAVFCPALDHNNRLHKRLSAPIILRLYATGGKHYACLWVNHSLSGTHLNGGGNAGGYGYHRASAAAQNALTDAGIELSDSISGRGDLAIEEALEAVAKTLLGRKKFYIHKANA